MLKADLHVHTEYSIDCNTSLEKIINSCLKVGINCIAVADHGTIEGALKMQSIATFPVIVAEEILTPRGEIMGMFLKDCVPNGLSVEQVISQIRAQDGLVCIPHPFDMYRPSALDARTIEEIVDQIDIIEIFNSRTPPIQNLSKARIFAEKYDIAEGAGSDAHTTYEIGNAYVEIPEFNGKDDFLQALRTGKVVGHTSNPLIHFASTWAKLKSRLKG